MSAFAAVAAFLYPVWENIRERDGFGMKILVTAFEPFGGDAVNPTMEALSRLAPREGLFKLVLPVTFAGAGERVARAIEELRPDAVLSLGLAGGRDRITPERVAINLDDARIADNDGFQPVDAPIAPDGPDAYCTTLPVREIARRMARTIGSVLCSNTRQSSGNASPTVPSKTQPSSGAPSLMAW